MKKKIFIVFIAILLGLGFSNVQAVTDNEVKAETLESLIARKAGNEYRTIGLNKYTLGNKVLYRTTGNTSEDIIQEELKNDVMFRVMRHGYHQVWENNSNLQRENDEYIVTQLAIDYIIDYSNLDEIDNVYRAASGLSSEQSTRADNILKRIKNLVKAGFDTTEKVNKGKAELVPVGEMQKEDGFVSQRYRVKVTNGEPINYNIENSSAYSVVDAETGEAKTSFSFYEDAKIMIPNKQSKSLETLKVSATVNYLEEKMYERANSIGRFVMLYKEEQTDNVETTLINTMKDENFDYDDGESDGNQEGNTGNIEENGTADGSNNSGTNGATSSGTNDASQGRRKQRR